MSQVAVNPTVRIAANTTVVRHLIEAGWLAAAGLVPLVVFHDDWMIGFIQMPKVFLLRTVALALVALMAIEWGMRRPSRRTEDELGVPGSPAERSAWDRVRASIAQHPAHLIFYGAGAVLLSNLISLAFSPVRSIGLTGVDPGWDTYGLYNVTSYMVVSIAVATHLRTADQVRRLLWTLTVTSILVSLYGVGQHFGIDWFRSSSPAVVRAPLTFGNPIFAASYLVMTVPLIIALIMPWGKWMSPIQHVLTGGGLLFIPFAAVLFTLSRGPWIGMIFMGFALLVLAARVLGQQAAVRILVILWLALAGALVLTAIPVQIPGGSGETVGGRLASSAPGVATGLDSRLSIWRTSLDTLFSVHWIDTEEFPEIPELAAKPLRPLIGYGPDMFQYAFPLAGSTEFTNTLASHGHSFVVHTALELGLIGVAAYGLMFGAVGLGLLRMLRSAREGAYPPWMTFVVIGLGAGLVGRAIEQIPGKAQVSDLTLSWVLVGFVVALMTMRFEEERQPARAPARRRRERGRTRSAAGGSLSAVRVGVVSLLTVVLAVVWYQSVAVHFASAFQAEEAGNSLEQGQIALAKEQYRDAVDLASSNSINRLQMAQALFVESNQAALDDRSALLEQAAAQARAVLDRNPLDHRAWSRVGEFSRELGALNSGDPVAAARNALVLANLMPGFWQARLALSWAYVRLGLNEQALTAVVQTKTLGSGPLENELVFYIQALSLQGLGRTEEAIEAATESMRIRPNTQAQQLLQSLGAL